MTGSMATRRMILCAGLQSGGTTLVSWCFLQRRDTNGVLDMPNDVIRTSFEEVQEPTLWVKMTIGSFQLLDVYEIYRDLGWEPEPLLVVRDVRAAYSSLMRKGYGFNGTTAEEPPLRMRFRRFLRDWELFRAKGWPVVKYEDFIRDGRAVLMRLCQAVNRPWDEGMTSWPKKLSEIAYVYRFDGLNSTFARSISQGSLTAARLQDKGQIQIDQLPRAELDWLEGTFSGYNAVHGYPKEIRHAAEGSIPVCMPLPGFEGTAREWYYSEHERLRSENESLWNENEMLRSENNRLLSEVSGPRTNRRDLSEVTLADKQRGQ